ncbi:NADPH2:quinone reductase [Frigoribacterium sp. PhB160]|uniref:medium chain dehydrogenase/reductase family protein n=1 Tax=Frigoribacterium sp. PhB160 TaxID=2485192 RepID=UPI000F49C00E|nr:medium chain dehydrogenase/reductase family protein [Frigoribacterium sp. PhB160]ROS58039.1 NADPH2:quinone reductase [Frigoribacterium sp. PhB160]
MIVTTTTRVVLPGVVEPSGLLLEQVAVASPGRGELLVAVEATGISFAEQSMRRGRYPMQPAFPFTPGYDLVGTVTAVGPGGDATLIGNRVASMTKTGAWTGHAVVPARDTVVVPDGVAAEDAEAVTVNGVTAWQMLHRSARVRPGQTILVFGANGGVGGLVVQLARHHGVHVVAAASPRHHDALRRAGADPVDYADPALAATVRALVPAGVDAVFDNIGGEVARTAWSLLAPGGTLVSYAAISALRGTGSAWPPFLRHLGWIVAKAALPNRRRATFYDLWSGHSARPRRFRSRLEQDLGRVLELVRGGVVTANIAARFPLTSVVEALELAESRTLDGKVILLP